MNCRYCGNVYSEEDRTCGGCGAPKQALRQTLLDAPATPEHWSKSLRQTVGRVLIATVALLVLIVGVSAIGLGALAALLAMVWALPVVPTLLTYAAWRDAKGDWIGFFMRLWLVFGIWSGIFFVMLMSIGIATTL